MHASVRFGVMMSAFAVSSAMRWHMAGVYVPYGRPSSPMTGSTITMHLGPPNSSMKLLTMAICSSEPKKPVQMPRNFRPSLRHCAMCSRMCGVKSCKL